MQEYNLSKVLSILKSSAEVSLSEIERATGLSKSYLSRLFRGERENPSLYTLMKICDFYYSINPNLITEALCNKDDKEKGELDIIMQMILNQENTMTTIDADIDLKLALKELFDEIEVYCNKEEAKGLDGEKMLKIADEIKKKVLILIRVKEDELNEKKWWRIPFSRISYKK